MGRKAAGRNVEAFRLLEFVERKCKMSGKICKTA